MVKRATHNTTKLLLLLLLLLLPLLTRDRFLFISYQQKESPVLLLLAEDVCLRACFRMKWGNLCKIRKSQFLFVKNILYNKIKTILHFKPTLRAPMADLLLLDKAAEDGSKLDWYGGSSVDYYHYHYHHQLLKFLELLFCLDFPPLHRAVAFQFWMRCRGVDHFLAKKVSNFQAWGPADTSLRRHFPAADHQHFDQQHLQLFGDYLDRWPHLLLCLQQ